MGFDSRPLRLAAAAALLAAVAVRDAGAAIVQVTDDDTASGCSSSAPVANAAATVVAWQSDCDPAGDNTDGSREIFRATVGSKPAQLTSATGCSSGNPTISADGQNVAFESTCNLAGTNPDANTEIFLWNGTAVVQLTNSLGCDNFAPSISGNGKFVAFDSTCNPQGTNNDGHGSEIYRIAIATLNLKKLTDDAVGDCDSTSASINADGTLVTFDSDCDLTGRNEDRAIEIFTVTATRDVAQMTFAGDDSCSSLRPSMDAAGSVIAFHSDCDFTGTNTDRSDEIFTVDTATKTVRQATDAAALASCASGEVHIASSGKALVYSSYCKVGGNTDGSVEVFQKAVGATTGAALAVTASSAGCTSFAGAISATGGLVVLDSDCNLATANADASLEVFRGSACTCGAPATRVAPPVASDALVTLRAAVGSAGCLLCECDTNHDAAITASDALRVLKFAVGQIGITLDCPAAS